MTSLSSGESYSYDANGNMTCRIEGGITYKQTYNTENRIASIQKLASGGTCTAPGNLTTKWDFTYDGDGVRAATMTTPYISGVPQTPVLTSYYFGGAYEVTGSTVRKYYSFAGQTILRNSTGLQYFLTDHLGSTVAITNASGTLISQQRYLPFGGVRQLGGSFITQTDFGYTGQRNDSYIKLMDYDFRWYAPELARFISPDSIVPNPSNPQSLNRYSYVNNNPIRFNDPTGHRPCGDGEAVDCDGNPNNIKITKTDCGGPGQKKCGGNDDDDDVSSLPTVILTGEDREVNPSRMVDDLSSLIDPFANQSQPVLFCRVNRCNIYLYDVPGEYRVDWSRVDGESLAWDVAGLIVSFVGLGPVARSLKLTSMTERTGLASANFVTGLGSYSNASENRDLAGMTLTVIGFYPPASIAASSASILNDLSDAVYFVPAPRGRIEGPPNLPACDTNAWPCN